MREQRLNQEQLQICRYGPCLVLGFRLIRVLNDLTEEKNILYPILSFQIYTPYPSPGRLYIVHRYTPYIYLLSADWL